MVKTLDSLKAELRGVLLNANELLNGRAGETSIIAYSAKGKEVKLIIKFSPATSATRFFVTVYDRYTAESSESQIMFNEYSKKSVEYSLFVGNNNNLVIKNNSGVRKAVEYILKAVGSVYGLPAQRVFIP